MAHEEFVSTAERLRREGREQGREQGRKEGVEEGRRDLLCMLLAQRFGKLSPAVRKRVERADSEAVERWAKRVLTAASLAEVFAEPGSRPRE